MLTKKENILRVAMELFAYQGYTNTSTSRIAKEARVSEGLIFRHFKNKQGLLDAIVLIGVDFVNDYLQLMESEPNPRIVIFLALEFPLAVIKENKDYWQLISSLKYQSPEIALKYQNSDIFKRMESVLGKALSDLDFEHPSLETKFLIFSILGLSNNIKQNIDEKETVKLINFIKSKYIK